MHKLSLASAVVAWFAGVSVLALSQDDTQAAALSQEIPTAISGRPFDKDLTDRFFRAVHVVRSLAKFDIAELETREEGGAWIVAEIIPGGLSGGLYLPRDSALPLVQYGGQWKLLETISGDTPPAEGRYEWKEPHVEHSFDRSYGMHDGVSVFVGEGNNPTVVCQFFKDKQGKEQFRSVTPIPEEWKTFVTPAIELLSDDAEILVANDMAALQKLAMGDNPFIALPAIRQLIAICKTDEERDNLFAHILALPKYRQAMFTYWALTANDKNLCERVLSSIGRAKQTEELAGIALGIESWTATFGRMPPVEAKELYEAVGEQWRNLDPKVPHDDTDYTIWWRFVTSPGNSEPELATDKC